MNNHQIGKILSSSRTTKNCFQGVYSLDQIERKTLGSNSGIVLNLSKTNQPGTHWVSLFQPIGGYMEYFDSFAMGPEVKQEIVDFLPEKFNFNRKRLQSAFNTTCGQYCIYYIYKKSLGNSLQSILDEFGDNYKENDFRVNRQVENIFNVDLEVSDTDFLVEQIAKEPTNFLAEFGLENLLDNHP